MNTLNKRQQQYKNTHEHIYRIATKMFATESYEKVTIRDICKKAAISIGTFYHHYASKESILNEGYRFFDEFLENEWIEKNFSNGEEQILFCVEMELTSMAENGVNYAIQFFKNQLTAQEKYILNTDRYFYIQLSAACSKWKKEKELNIETKKLTDLILRSTRGSIYDWCLHNGDYDLITEGKGLVHLLLLALCY